jgi:hypothetical protein
VISPDAVLVPVFCGDLDSAGSYAVVGVDDREGGQRWRTAGPTGLAWEEVELTTSPDGHATRYQARLDSQSSEAAPILLDSATGAVRYRPVVTVGVYSRTDGARNASLSGTGRRRELTTVPGPPPERLWLWSRTSTRTRP